MYQIKRCLQLKKQRNEKNPFLRHTFGSSIPKQQEGLCPGCIAAHETQAECSCSKPAPCAYGVSSSDRFAGLHGPNGEGIPQSKSKAKGHKARGKSVWVTEKSHSFPLLVMHACTQGACIHLELHWVGGLGCYWGCALHHECIQRRCKPRVRLKPKP